MDVRIMIAALVGVTGCVQLERVGGDGGSAGIPDEVQRVFDERCNQGGCHGNGTAQQGLSLDAADAAGIIGGQAVQVAMPLVELGSVENSYLAQKMLASPTTTISGTRMPQLADFADPAVLTDNAIVIGWIAGADLPGGGGGGGSGGSAGDTAGSSGGSMLGPCGLDEVDPGASNPIVSGNGADQIPTEIGTILTDNCGCHLSTKTSLPGYLAYPTSLPFKITTIAEWRAEYMAGVTNIDKAKDRVVSTALSPMPQPAYCDVGGGEPMPPADRQTLLDWLDAGAPDGANWP